MFLGTTERGGRRRPPPRWQRRTLVDLELFRIRSRLFDLRDTAQGAWDELDAACQSVSAALDKAGGPTDVETYDLTPEQGAEAEELIAHLAALAVLARADAPRLIEAARTSGLRIERRGRGGIAALVDGEVVLTLPVRALVDAVVRSTAHRARRDGAVPSQAGRTAGTDRKSVV